MLRHVRLLLIALFTWAAVVPAQAAVPAPVQVVRNLTDSVLGAVRADPTLKAGNPQKVAALVQDKVLPFLDFRQMTASAVGRYWRTATPQQQDALQEQFKQLLIHTYSGAIDKIHDQQVQYLPFRGQPDATDAVVRTRVIDNGDVIQLDYRLENDGGQWKIYDVNVMGIWLVDNYRGVFAEQIGSHGIDGLITTLKQRNAALAAAKKD